MEVEKQLDLTRALSSCISTQIRLAHYVLSYYFTSINVITLYLFREKKVFFQWRIQRGDPVHALIKLSIFSFRLCILVSFHRKAIV